MKIELEADGRFKAEVPELPGALVYGATEAEARMKAAALSLRIIADHLRLVVENLTRSRSSLE